MNSPTVFGVDEAGRGALAGPLVSCGVRINISQSLRLKSLGLPLRDGKLLTRNQRHRIVRAMEDLGIFPATECISAADINSVGIQKANVSSFRLLVNANRADAYYVDGLIRPRNDAALARIFSIVDADAVLLPVILAGIAAKHARDRIMEQMNRTYPVYGWDRNAGYGTRRHIMAIREFGTTPHHRTVYVRTAVSNYRPA